MYKITEEYLTGIQIIDEEHTHLFDLAEEAYQLLQEQFLHDKYDQIMAIFEELKNYTKKHFSDEEEYMESIDYSAIFIQKAQHKQFIEKLEDFMEQDIEEEQDARIQEILTFLTDWLTNHILKMDKLIGIEV